MLERLAVEQEVEQPDRGTSNFATSCSIASSRPGARSGPMQDRQPAERFREEDLLVDGIVQ